MIKETDISIVIVNYNVKDFLFQCLRSIDVATQNLNVETIVIDNNSSDGSVDFLSPLFQDVFFYKLDDNLGFASANNVGFGIAKGKYILILNPDTILAEDTLTKMYNYMENNIDVGCSGCKVLNPDGTFQLACRRGFPTPWASFSKLFGFQKIFPKSRIFAQYNQTFKSIEESYEIDAVIGAFMFCRKEVIDEVKGFDTNFFMYGEDLDLCYRIKKANWKITYFHETSIIHYKGESTKRSSINEIKHFYNAMEIFSKKHYSNSFFFLKFLKLGIILRALIAYLNKFKKDIFVMIWDIVSINLALLFGTWYRFNGIFNFPDYAYPIVFIVVTLVMLTSMLIVGEYFETKPSARKALFGLMISFFILSSLTYYFKNFAFSRGVLIMTIGLSGLSAITIRSIFSLLDKTKGTEADKRIALVGLNEKAINIVNNLKNSELRNIVIVGLISPDKINNENYYNLPIIGNVEFIWNIIKDHNIHEVIVTDPKIAKNELINILSGNPGLQVRFHVAQEFEELLSARIINDITGIEPTIPDYNMNKFRFKVLKRFSDLLISAFLLTFGFPLLYLFNKKVTYSYKLLLKVFFGKMSVVGIYNLDENSSKPGKNGIIGLVQISKPNTLSNEATENLNDFYRQHYSFSLDIDIIIKFLFRKKSGSNRYP